MAGAAQAIFARQEPGLLHEASLDVLLPDWRERPVQAALQQAFALGQAMTNDQAIAFGLESTAPYLGSRGT